MFDTHSPIIYLDVALIRDINV